jgi:hypothetical protein
LKGRNKPYLRIVCDDADQLEEITGSLAPLGLDIQVLLLDTFIPGRTAEVRPIDESSAKRPAGLQYPPGA